MMSDFIADEFKQELEVGETLQWCGRPQQGYYFRSEDIFNIPISVVLGGISILLGFYYISSGTSFFPILFGIMLILFGVYMSIGKFLFDFWQRKNTYYAITDRRIMILYGIKDQYVKSIPLDDIKEPNIRGWKNGKGTLHFGINAGLAGKIRQSSYDFIERLMFTPSFEMIDEVDKVENLIKRLQKEKTVIGDQ